MLNKNPTMDLARRFLEQFREAASPDFPYAQVPIDRHRFFLDFFAPEKLATADWAYFQRLRANIHAFQYPAIAGANALGRPNHPVEHYRAVFQDLAGGPGDTRDRIRRFLDLPENQLKYFGFGARSEIVAYLYADDYVMCNNVDQEAVSYLGFPTESFKSGSRADRFFAFNELVAPLLAAYRHIVGSRIDVPLPLQLDRFFYWLTSTKPPRPEAPDASPARTWVLSAGRKARYWDEFVRDGVIALGGREMGDLQQYADKEAVFARAKAQRHEEGDAAEPVNDALGWFQFAREMQVGDEVFIKKNRSTIIGWGVVASDYFFDADRDYPHVRKVTWRGQGEWKLSALLPMKALTDVSSYVEFNTEIRSKLGSVPPAKAPPFDPTPILADLFLPREQIDKIVDRLRQRKNVVIQGPPGVGKTFVARRLAYLAMEAADPERVELVQFHQSYGYEDFVQGYRPNEDGGFERRDGVFLRFCQRARTDPRTHVLIIDEINRGNLSRILGELMMLIEPDKRGAAFALPLTYSRDGEPPFFVPDNLYVIGTMNTADRSLAMVDYALRRRFSFFDLRPAFGTPQFRDYLQGAGAAAGLVDRIEGAIQAVNALIEKDKNLGPGFLIGHSHFCPPRDIAPDDKWLSRVIETDIQPLLREYWFDRVDSTLTEAFSLLARLK